MKAFNFSLQKLLDAKDALEKAAEIRVSDAQRKLNQAEKRLEQLREQMESQSLKHVEKLKGWEKERHDMSVHLLFVHRLERHFEKQEEVVNKSRQKLKEAHSVLLTAMRERKSLENLKEREMNQWVIAVRRADRKEMDEIAIMRFVRQERIAL
jgi:flagellar protein FliJ